MEGEAGETWKIWLRWGFTQETAGRELESEGVGRELTLPPWASIFLGFEAGIRGPIGPPQAVSGVGGGSGRERREEGGHPADTLQGREWRLSRWKFRRSLPRANCTPVQDKNSPSSHHRPPQLPRVRSDTCSLEAPSQMINIPSQVQPLPTEDSSLSQHRLVTEAKITSHVSRQMPWVTLTLSLSQEILVTGVCPSHQKDSWGP